MDKKVITRFAPSPTGYMHVGGVRTALFAWAFARKNNGNFILRIEDTDKAREVEGSIEHIIESLKWIGIEWDEGPDIGGKNAPYLQSERLDSYKKYAQILIDKGLAYADPYTEEDLQKFKAEAKKNKKPFLYRNHRPKNPPKWDGTMPLRLKITKIEVSKWHDEVRGHLEAGPEALDDFILIKSDGYPTYNFAHIIDDLEMGVTHIFRADEFISSVPKYLALYEALEITRPKMITLPPIMRQDGKKKLGKRDGAKDLLDYKKEGFLPEAMMNFLAFIGWNPGGEKEIYSKEEFIEAFSIEKIQKSGGKFNEEKLLWYNREYILKMNEEEIEKLIKKSLPDELKKDEKLKKLIPLIKERIKTLEEISGVLKELNFIFKRPNLDKTKIKFTKEQKENILALLKSEKNFVAENIKSALWEYATKEGRGVILGSLRYTLSGMDKSPDPFVICEILGKEETLERLSLL